MKRILTCLTFFIFILTPYILTHSSITDFGVIKHRREYEQAYKTKAGKVYVFDSRVNSKNEHEFRLSPKHEIVNTRLFEMLLVIEGDENSMFDLYKGAIKGAMTVMGINNVAIGGSTLRTSISGSLLGHRVNTNESSAILNRLQEWVVVGAMNQLPKEQEIGLILSEACQVGNITGCTLSASHLLGRQPQSDDELLLMAATVRYPFTNNNRERIAKYMRSWCKSGRLAAYKLKTNCNYDSMVGDLKAQGGVRVSSILNQAFFHQNVREMDLRDMINIHDVIQRIHNGNVEVSIHELNQESQQIKLLRVTNNPTLIEKGFSSQSNIASIAKLIALLNDSYVLSEANVSCFARSVNECVYTIYQNIGEMKVRQFIRDSGITLKYKQNILYDLSYGHASMNSHDIHTLLHQLFEQRKKMPISNKNALNAAFVNPNGTMSKYRKAFLHGKIRNVFIAKSGTHAVRANSSRDGVYGSLATFVLKRNDGRIFSIVIRFHSRNMSKPLCNQSGCTNTTMKELVEIAILMVNKFNEH